jgi:hypothetical protein
MWQTRILNKRRMHPIRATLSKLCLPPTLGGQRLAPTSLLYARSGGWASFLVPTLCEMKKLKNPKFNEKGKSKPCAKSNGTNDPSRVVRTKKIYPWTPASTLNRYPKRALLLNLSFATLESEALNLSKRLHSIIPLTRLSQSLYGLGI